MHGVSASRPPVRSLPCCRLRGQVARHPQSECCVCWDHLALQGVSAKDSMHALRAVTGSQLRWGHDSEDRIDAGAAARRCWLAGRCVMHAPIQIAPAHLDRSYWIVGLSPTVRFLQYWAQLFLTNLWSVSLFQVRSAIHARRVLCSLK